MNRNRLLLRIALCGMIAALYAAASLVLAPISFGNIQLRVAESLTLLPVLFPDAVIGVTLGCALTNAIGAITGANILGGLDVLFGTLATFLSALCTYYLRNIRFKNVPYLSALPPVLFNALIIGGELTYVMIPGGFSPLPFLIFSGQVALGQFAACYLLGLPLLGALEKSGLAKKFMNSAKKQ